MIHPYDPQAAMNAKYAAFARENAAPRAPQAATATNGAGDDAGAAHDPHKPAAGHTEPPMRPEDVPAPEHAHNGNEQANEQALRDRIASAIENRAHLCLIECDCDGDHPILVTTSAGDAESGPHIIAVEGSPRALADAVMTVIQPELDQHWADLACRTNERDQWREEARLMTENRDYWRDQVAKEWRQRAEAAEAAEAAQPDVVRLYQLLIDERTITARLGRELAQLQHNISAAHQHLNEIATERDAAIERAEAAEAKLRDQNGHHT